MTTSPRQIRWRYYRTSLAFWLGMIFAVQGTIVTATAIVLGVVGDDGSNATLLLGVLGGVMALFGFGALVHALRRAALRARLLADGVPLVGVVTALHEDWWVNYWDHHPVYLTYAFLDELGEKRFGKSPYLVRGREKCWPAGTPILVLVDRDDPARHEADVDGVRQHVLAELTQGLDTPA